MSRRFLSVVETAEALGVSDDLVHDLIARGELPAVVSGRRKLVPARALEVLEEVAMSSFDPARLVRRLADAEDASSGAPSGPAGPPPVAALGR